MLGGRVHPPSDPSAFCCQPTCSPRSCLRVYKSTRPPCPIGCSQCPSWPTENHHREQVSYFGCCASHHRNSPEDNCRLCVCCAAPTRRNRRLRLSPDLSSITPNLSTAFLPLVTLPTLPLMYGLPAKCLASGEHIMLLALASPRPPTPYHSATVSKHEPRTRNSSHRSLLHAEQRSVGKLPGARGQSPTQ